MNNLQLIFIREEIIKSIRQFFYAKGFHEAVVPVLNSSLPLEQNIYAFKTVWQTVKGKKDLYFSTSPEAYLKKMTARGFGNCFAIGHTFRNLEDTSVIHTPEFLMLEWYRENATYEDIMDECEKLINYILKKNKEQTTNNKKIANKINLRNPWKRISMVGVFKKYAGLNLEEIIDDRRLQKVAKNKGYEVKGKTWENIFNQIFLNEVEGKLPHEPFFLTDYPAKISPLCAPRRDKPYLAQRFELYMDGIEIGNGNTENTNAKEVLRQMKIEQKRRRNLKIDCPPIDMDFIDALGKMEGKNYAGIGLGIDRLAMILAKISEAAP